MARLPTMLLAFSVGASSACSAVVEPTPLAQDVFVGRVSGSDMALAVVVEEGAVTAYACGGLETLESTTWLRGEARDGRVSAQSERGALRGTIDGDSLRGTWVDAQGVRRDVALDRAVEGAGLFESREAACRTGVIVLDPAQGQAQGAGCDAAGRRSQVTPIRPWTMSTSGLAARAALAPERVIYVRPVHPSLQPR